MPRDFISPTSSGLKSQTGKLTASLTNGITRKLTGDELEQLFLEKFKLTLGSELIANGNFDDTSAWTALEDATINPSTNSATIDGTSITSHILQGVLTEGKTYVLTFDVSSDNGSGNRWITNTLGGGGLYYSVTGNGSQYVIFTHTHSSSALYFTARSGGSFVVSNVSVKEAIKQAPLAAFSLRKLGNVSPYACRIRRSSDNTEAQVMFDASDRVSESSVVRNTANNILPSSEDFTAWDVTAVSRTLDSVLTDPFGGSNAYKLNETAANSFHFISEVVTIPSGAYTFSCYMKAGERTTGSLMLTQSGNFGAVFDLSAGSVSSVNGTGNTASIEAVGTDGWYRCAIHNNGSANIEDFVRIAPQNGVLTSFTGDASKGIYIFGSQLEETVTYESTGSTVTGFDSTFSGTGPKQWGSSNASLASVSGGKGVFNTDSTQNLRIFTLLTIGKKYKVQFDVEDYVSGSVRVNTPFSAATYNAFTAASADGTYTFEGIAALDALYISTIGATELKIDNVVVTEFDPIPSEYISTPVISNDGLTFTESTLDTFVGGENLIRKSEDFSSNWINENLTLTADASVTDPFGGTGAFKCVKTGNAGNQRLYDGAKDGSGASLTGGAGDVYTFSVYVKPTGTTVGLRMTASGTSSVLQDITVTPNVWQRISFSHTTTGAYTGLTLFLYPCGTGADNDSTTGGDAHIFGAQLNTDSLKTYQKTSGTSRDGNAGIVVLYNQTGGEDAIQETPAEQPLLYKEGLLVRSGSSPAWYYRDKSSGNDDVLSIPSLAGISRLDAFFVHDSGSDTTFMYPTGTTGKWGMIATQFNATTNWQNYKADDSSLVFVNGTQGSPTDRGELYNLLNGRKLVHHQNGETTSWTAFNMADYNQFGSNSLNPDDFKFSEWIFFDSNQSANRTSIEKDINDFHNIF